MGSEGWSGLSWFRIVTWCWSSGLHKLLTNSWQELLSCREKPCSMLLLNRIACFVFLWRCGPTRTMASSFTRFLRHAQRRTTVGRTPLDEWSALRRDLYWTTHKHPCPQRDSNPKSQQESGSRPTPQTGTQLLTMYHWNVPLGSCLLSFTSAVPGRSLTASSRRFRRRHFLLLPTAG